MGYNSAANSGPSLQFPRSVRTRGWLWMKARRTEAATTGHFSGHSENLSTPWPSSPLSPWQTPPTSLKGAPKLKALGETWAFCIVRNGGAVWKKDSGRRRLIYEISLLTCSNSILLKLFIMAQCSDAKCFPSESEGFKWIVLHCHLFLTETTFGISNIRQKIRAY